MKKVGIIGSGVVGKALAKGFINHGYPTTIASRSEDTRKVLAAEFDDRLKTDTPENTAKDNDIIVFAVKGTAAKDALKGAGISHLDGKTIIDATNPIAADPPINGVLQFFTDINHSLMEELQSMAPKANFVKAFNSVTSGLMVNPKLESQPTMFICGNNDAAKAEVSTILNQFGWGVEDMGKVEAARAIEPLCMLCCIPGFQKNSWAHAFKLVR